MMPASIDGLPNLNRGGPIDARRHIKRKSPNGSWLRLPEIADSSAAYHLARDFRLPR